MTLDDHMKVVKSFLFPVTLEHYKSLYKVILHSHQQERRKRAKALMFVQDLELKNEALEDALEFNEETISMLYHTIEILKRENNSGEN